MEGMKDKTMTDAEMKAIKVEGTRAALFTEWTSKISAARCILERSLYDDGKNFKERIDDARKYIDDAEQIWEERKKV